MKEDIEEIIRKLGIISELLYKNRYSEAATAVYEAESMAIFIRDKANNTGEIKKQ